MVRMGGLPREPAASWRRRHRGSRQPRMMQRSGLRSVSGKLPPDAGIDVPRKHLPLWLPTGRASRSPPSALRPMFLVGIRERLLNTLSGDTTLVGLRQLDHDAQDISGRVFPLVIEKEAQEVEYGERMYPGPCTHEGHLDYLGIAAARPARRHSPAPGRQTRCVHRDAGLGPGSPDVAKKARTTTPKKQKNNKKSGKKK